MDNLSTKCLPELTDINSHPKKILVLNHKFYKILQVAHIPITICQDPGSNLQFPDERGRHFDHIANPTCVHQYSLVHFSHRRDRCHENERMRLISCMSVSLCVCLSVCPSPAYVNWFKTNGKLRGRKKS